MANGKIRFGKQSGGELALVIPDGVDYTEVTFPESGELVNKDYADLKQSKNELAYDVDTSSYIPNTLASSAIIERGSNANGEYIKYADGTLICTSRQEGGTTGNGGGSSTGAFFAHTFIDTNIKTAFSEETFGLNCKLTFSHQTTSYIAPHMKTSTGTNVALGTTLPTYNLIAFGRWK